MNSAGELGDIRKSGSLYTKGRNRPGFETLVYRALPGEGVNAGAARCHFVSFEVIQSILLEILNRYVKKNTQQEFYAAICDFAQIFLNFYTDQEYKDKVAAKIQDVWFAFRVNMTMGRFEEQFLREVNQYLSYLNSCPGNLRFPFDTSVGNSWNSSIGSVYDPGEWSCWFQGVEVSDPFGSYYAIPIHADLGQVEVRLSAEDGQRIRSVNTFCQTYQVYGSLKLATAYTQDENGKYPFVYSSDNGFDIPESCSDFSGRIIF